jgi:hypothetical protein
MPVGCTNTPEKAVIQLRQAIVENLGEAELAFQQFLASQTRSGRAEAVREACVSIAMIRAYQACLLPNKISSEQDIKEAVSLLGKLTYVCVSTTTR